MLIEKKTDDVGALNKFYKEYRQRFFKDMLAYIQRYIAQGTFRNVEYPEHCAQLISETLAWWGMHVMNDAFDVQKDIPPETAKSVCMDNLLHAYKA